MQEKSYGGDGATLATDACCATPSTGLQYLIRKTYDSNNFLTTAAYLDPATCTDISQSTCVAILTTADVTTDKTSGLVTSSRDVAGVQTTYDYDATGRLESVIPTGGASRSYTYTAATTSTNAQVTESVTGTSGTSIDTSTFEFDGLGRVRRVSTPLPNGKLASVQTDYDEYGRKRRISQPLEQTTHPTTSIGTYWTTFGYDALGRQTSLTAPDGTSTTITYTGARRTTRTASVATSIGGITDTITTEHYDALGRLRRVEQAAGNTSATNTTGTTTATDYTYDVAGRLTSVSDGTSTQADRSFTYDGRGFLAEESHPENGTTTYAGYDARGHARKRTSGGRTVRFTFDAAERLTKVTEEISGTEKVLKEFSFATANSGTNLQKGKLVTAIRHNERPAAGQIETKETYIYETPAGLLSKRTALVQHVIGNTRTTVQQFDYSVAYDDYGLPATVSMPTCSANGCSVTGGLVSVTLNRSAGFLSSVQNVASLTYHRNGTVKTVQHLSVRSATDTYAVTSGMARPSSITFSAGTETCPELAGSTIATPASACPNSAGNTASVTPRSGVTHTWTIAGGGTITSGTTGDAVTFTAPSSGVFTLTVTATDTCNQTASSSKSITIEDAPTPPTISAPSAVCGGSAGNSASVAARAGITHTWSISGGSITSSATGDAITFTASASGSVTLTVTATDTCGTTAASSKNVSITPLPHAALSGSNTIVRGSSTVLSVTLSGFSPWRLEWSDGFIQSNVTSFSTSYEVRPNVTTSYDLAVSSGDCVGTSSGPVTVTVIPAPPASVIATTQENRNVTVSWSAVAGASGYRIERTTRRDAATSWSTTVGSATTSFSDVVPASEQPVTYIYYVRTIDAYGELSDRGPWDHATAATALYAQPISAGVTIVRATDVGELRGAIDALRYAFYLADTFTGSPTGFIRASDITALVTAFNEARGSIGAAPFAYSGVPAPAPGGMVLGAHIQQLREALR